MAPQQIAFVRQSFAQLMPIAQEVPQMFYKRLFELDPSLRKLFKNDLREQGEKLLQMLAVAVDVLDRPDILLPTARQLGARHEGYGVEAEDYQTVGEALLWTLEQGFGPAFTPDVKQAWTETYVLLSTVMQGKQLA